MLSKQNNTEGETWDQHQMRTMNQHQPKEKAETSSLQWKGSAPDAEFAPPRVEVGKSSMKFPKYKLELIATPGEHSTKHFSP